MTVKELIEELQKLPEDMPVYIETDHGTSEVEAAQVEPAAIIEVTYKMDTEKVMVIHNGQEIMVDIPRELPVYTNIPGVVIS